MIGRELNPRIGDFDLKFFTELRPGLMGWLALDICMAIKQYVDLGRITNSMILVLLFQGWYVIDALYNEVCLNCAISSAYMLIQFNKTQRAPF